jgi:hypothetical protein
MPIQEVLERACHQWSVRSRDFALLLNDKKTISVPVDKTVAILCGRRDLILAPRSTLPECGYVTKIAADSTSVSEEAHG